MPSDYRSGRAGLRPVTSRTMFIAPDGEPDYAISANRANGPMTAEERAGWHLMGVPRLDAANLHRAGVHPFDIEKWSDAGLPIDAYGELATLHRAGVTPEQYAKYPRGLGVALLIAMHQAGMSASLAGQWQRSFAQMTGGHRNLADSVMYHSHGITPAMHEAMAEALGRGPSKVEVLDLHAIGDLEVAAALLRSKVKVADVRRKWALVVEVAGESLGRALVLVGADLAMAGQWRATGLTDHRCALLARAGFSPAEALGDGVVALADDDVEVLAVLAAPASPASMALAGP